MIFFDGFRGVSLARASARDGWMVRSRYFGDTQKLRAFGDPRDVSPAQKDSLRSEDGGDNVLAGPETLCEREAANPRSN